MDYQKFIEEDRYTWRAVDHLIDKATEYYNNEDVVPPCAEAKWTREYTSPGQHFAIYEFEFGDIDDTLVKRVQLEDKEEGIDFLHHQVKETEFRHDRRRQNLNGILKRPRVIFQGSQDLISLDE